MAIRFDGRVFDSPDDLYLAGFCAGKRAEHMSKEQCYQQLEQVTKEMLEWFDIFLEEWGDDLSLSVGARKNVIHDKRIFRKQLEALGVRVDD